MVHYMSIFFCSPLGKFPIFTGVPVQDFFGNSMRESSISAGDTQWKHRVFMPIGSLVGYRYRTIMVQRAGFLWPELLGSVWVNVEVPRDPVFCPTLPSGKLT